MFAKILTKKNLVKAAWALGAGISGIVIASFLGRDKAEVIDETVETYEEVKIVDVPVEEVVETKVTTKRTRQTPQN
jgi:hypothetical protein